MSEFLSQEVLAITSTTELLQRTDVCQGMFGCILRETCG